MKIISWNVNGIRAAWNHGLLTFLDNSDADIYCFQETKVSERIQMMELEGYYPYWSFCTSRKAYSGTMCLTRIEPISVRYDLGNSRLSMEGRIITLEYHDFFLINCYFPNSQHSNDRKDFRDDWDRDMYNYVVGLKSQKPVIICGDFNVTLSTDDIYAENRWVEINSQGFQSIESENIEKLMDLGFTDSFKYIHPAITNKYTWWSSRKFKRAENRGWRLDYFLVDDILKDKLYDADILDEVLGSDHCPIQIDIDIAQKELSTVKSKPRHKCRYRYSDLAWMGQREFLKINSTIDLSGLWDSIHWETVKANIRVMQEALAKSAYSRNSSLIEKWQKKIVFSMDAKVYAVKRVCETATSIGVDKVQWLTSHEKMAAAISLTSKNYKAMPSRLIIVKSKNGKERRIHIVTYYDRAMQVLYSLALDPVAESWSDKKSFAFRRGRSSWDVDAYIRKAFEGQDAPHWAFVGDVHDCYGSFKQDWILKNIPMDSHVLEQFLEAGFVANGDACPMEKGIGTGWRISPTIANMSLDGLQNFIFNKIHGSSRQTYYGYGEEDFDYADGNLIRYMDDIIITTRTKETAEKVQGWVNEFLRERGLGLSQEKSHIINIYDGFDFMSRTYIKHKTHVYVYPSEKSITRFKGNIEQLLTGYSGSQKHLIEKINRKIDGWVTYHKISDAEDAFRKIDVYIKTRLLELCKEKHPNWSIDKILERYWYQDYDGQYYYALPEDKGVRVKTLADTVLVSYTPVKTNKNPYIDFDYFEERTNKREIQTVAGKYNALWKRQDGRCYYCGRKILRGEAKEVVEVAFGRKAINRIAYVHTRCTSGSIEYIDTEYLPETSADVIEMLCEFQKERKLKDPKYWKLDSFFRTSTAATITLTFKKIEEIIGGSLCKTARERKEFWYRKGMNTISQCWLENNYIISEFDLRGETIKFQMTSNVPKTINIEIPNEIATKRLPLAAKYEIEHFFKYIINKYGL